MPSNVSLESMLDNREESNVATVQKKRYDPWNLMVKKLVLK